MPTKRTPASKRKVVNVEVGMGRHKVTRKLSKEDLVGMGVPNQKAAQIAKEVLKYKQQKAHGMRTYKAKKGK